MDAASRVLILATDDQLARAARNAGHAVAATADPHEAAAQARAAPPAVAVVDGRTDEILLTRLLTDLALARRTRDVPVLAIVAAGRVAAGMAAGATDCLADGFDDAELTARIQAHARTRGAQRALRAENARLRRAALFAGRTPGTDPRAGLQSLRGLEARLALDSRTSAGTDDAHSLLRIGIDHYQPFEHACGSAAARTCREALTELIRATCPPAAHMAADGDDRFAILVLDCPENAALELAERIRSVVTAQRVPHPANPPHDIVTISVGATTVAATGWRMALLRAEAALHVARHAGRNRVERAQADPLPAARQPGVEPATILVADDDPTVRRLCRAALEPCGYRIIEAGDGREALAQAWAGRPDVILMDIMMPELDGLACIRELRARLDTRDTPIIIVSAIAKQSTVIAGLEAGADEYLIKPLRLHELKPRINSMVRLRREQAELQRSYEERGEHLRMLARLMEFAQAVCACSDRQELLEHTLDAVVDLALVSRAALGFCDPRLRQPVITALRGFDGAPPEAAAAILAAAAGQHALQADDAGDPRLAELAAAGVDTRLFQPPFVALPLPLTDQPPGILYLDGRARAGPFTAGEVEYFTMVLGIARTALESEALRRARDEASDSIMVALAKLAEFRDTDTGQHLDRVTTFCLMLARRLRSDPRYAEQIDDAFLFALERAVPLHDIGKVGIPDQILLKPGRLTADQMSVMRTHTVIGARAIEALRHSAPSVGFLEIAARIARHHHERYDGSGYPDGLAGDAIPLEARIVSVADVYDALTTRRVYKEAMPHDRGVAIIVEGRGTQFDPDVVDAFIELEREFRRLAGEMADAATPAAGGPAPVAPAAAAVG